MGGPSGWQQWLVQLQTPGMYCNYIESELVNVSGVQESIPPGWESIPGLLKRFTNSGSEFRCAVEDVKEQFSAGAAANLQKRRTNYLNFFLFSTSENMTSQVYAVICLNDVTVEWASLLNDVTVSCFRPTCVMPTRL